MYEDLKPDWNLGDFLRSPKLWTPLMIVLFVAIPIWIQRPWQPGGWMRTDKFWSMFLFILLGVILCALVHKTRTDWKKEKLRRQRESWHRWTHP